MPNTTPAAADLQSLKHMRISLQIIALIADGLTPIEAFRTVCGTEAVNKAIDDLYVQLRLAGERRKSEDGY